MRAALYYGRNDIRLEDVAEPEIAAGDVKLRVRYAGICGSDLHEYYSGPIYTSVTAHPFTGIKNPAVIGHELCGEVIELGAGVDGLELGDLVAVAPVQPCGSCHWCGLGKPSLCEAAATHGYNRVGGGLAEFTVVRRSMAHRLPDTIDAFRGALIEPLTIGYSAVLPTGARAGRAGVVHGVGPIGLGALFAMRAMDVVPIAFDPSRYRRGVAAALGFNNVFDPTAVDVVEVVRDLTGGHGAEASIDAAGAPSVLDSCLDSTRENGTVVLVATSTAPVVLDVRRVRRFGLKVTSTAFKSPAVFRQVIDWMATGMYPVDGWVETIAFDDLLTEGFEALQQQRKMKIVVDMESVSAAGGRREC